MGHLTMRSVACAISLLVQLGCGGRDESPSQVEALPPSDAELESAIAEFQSRCERKLRSDKAELKCNCLLIMLATELDRAKADLICMKEASASALLLSRSELLADKVEVSEADKQKEEILAKTISDRDEFFRVNSLTHWDGWVGKAGLKLDFRDLERAVWRHIGERVRFRGKAYNVSESPEGVLLQLDACMGNQSCDLIATMPFGGGTDGTNIRKGDKVWVYGYVLDEYAYESTTGRQMKVPRIAAVGAFPAR